MYANKIYFDRISVTGLLITYIRKTSIIVNYRIQEILPKALSFYYKHILSCCFTNLLNNLKLKKEKSQYVIGDTEYMYRYVYLFAYYF